MPHSSSATSSAVRCWGCQQEGAASQLIGGSFEARLHAPAPPALHLLGWAWKWMPSLPSTWGQKASGRAQEARCNRFQSRAGLPDLQSGGNDKSGGILHACLVRERSGCGLHWLFPYAIAGPRPSGRMPPGALPEPTPLLVPLPAGHEARGVGARQAVL